jgi:pimeloyl-ACP methyl ester carboxylesterase
MPGCRECWTTSTGILDLDRCAVLRPLQGSISDTSMTTTYAHKQTTIRGHAVKINDMEMYYEEHGVGKPLVLLHEFGGCAQNWLPFTAEFSERHQLIVVDLRGHGHSTDPENKFTHREAATDVFLLLEKLGVGHFSVMGISSGGMTLLHMATSQPKRIIPI